MLCKILLLAILQILNTYCLNSSSGLSFMLNTSGAAYFLWLTLSVALCWDTQIACTKIILLKRSCIMCLLSYEISLFFMLSLPSFSNTLPLLLRKLQSCQKRFKPWEYISSRFETFWHDFNFRNNTGRV